MAGPFFQFEKPFEWGFCNPTLADKKMAQDMLPPIALCPIYGYLPPGYFSTVRSTRLAFLSRDTLTKECMGKITARLVLGSKK